MNKPHYSAADFLSTAVLGSLLVGIAMVLDATLIASAYTRPAKTEASLS